MKFNSKDSFKSLDTLNSTGKDYKYFNLKTAEKNGLEGISKLPKSLKVLLENLLRYEDNVTVDNGLILSGFLFLSFTASLIAARSAIAGIPV